jgi:hypothetical protein
MFERGGCPVVSFEQGFATAFHNSKRKSYMAHWLDDILDNMVLCIIHHANYPPFDLPRETNYVHVYLLGDQS